MFEHLTKYRVIIVTGPQRSGTTICAKMIAHDTGKRFVAEEAFGVHSREHWESLVLHSDDAVIQCPTMCAYVGNVLADDVLVVMVHRSLVEIHESEKRIGWREHLRELERYGLSEGDPAAVKYAAWDRQRKQIPHTLDVAYHDLATHPLWVPKEQRAGFGHRQTR